MTMQFTAGERGLIEGNLAEIRYQNARDGFCVGLLQCDDGRRIDVVGPLAQPEVGMQILLLGSIENNPRFGLQFVIESQVDPDTDTKLAYGYLAAGLIKHIGPVAAKAIIERYGSDTIRQLATEPEDLVGIRGVTAERLPIIRRNLRETLHLAPIVGLLDPFGISTTVCKRIWRRHGPRAVELIRANPWRLANEIAGVGFTSADKIAQGLGVAMNALERIEAATLQAIRNAAREEGHVLVNRNVIIAATAGMASVAPAAVEEAIDRLIVSEEIEAHPRGLALPHLASAERIVAAKLNAMLNFDDTNPISITQADLEEVERSEGITFDASQQRAVGGALAERVSVITGNPGTGKTTIVRAVLDLAEARGLSVALVSPTGRAAKRMSETTGRPAATIHRWLRYHPQTGFAGPEKLPDMLVVDEASMIGSSLAARLLTVLPPYTRLVFVGDADQLPAVDPGNVLGDMISSGRIGVFRLTHIHRTAAGSGVPSFAAAIAAGEFPKPDNKTTRFVRRDDPDGIATYITGVAERYADRIEEFQVLSPMKKGPAGTAALNRAIQAIVNPPVDGAPTVRRDGFELRAGDRVMQTSNDYANNLFNGEIGTLTAIDEDGSLTLDLDGEQRKLAAGTGEGLTLAYAVTVHRAQGSEFPIVIVAFHQSAYMQLNKRVLYTAVSRAQNTVAIVGSTKAIGMALHDWGKSTHRQTLLHQLLGETEVAPVLAALPDLAEEDF